MKVTHRSRFNADYESLLADFRDKAGPAVAWRFVQAVEQLFHLLARHPLLGRVRPGLKPAGVRSFVVPGFKNHVLFYLARDNELIMLRLRHGGMSLETLFN